MGPSVSATMNDALSRLRTNLDPDLIDIAGSKRDAAWGNRITYSPKVFIPLTKLCRDVCHYCTFARPPAGEGPVYMSEDEVLAVARAGAEAGCREALFTLGDKPELRYRSAREELRRLGFSTTIEYLARVASLVIEQTGLLPHINAGVMTPTEMASLREVSASMGLMLESTSLSLMQPGEAHHGSPDKDPSVRIAMMQEAGRQKIPFTTGLLVGIGETWQDRIATLQAIADSHEQWGHIQEVIIQNFRAKPGTPMYQHPEPTVDETIKVIVAARLVLPDEISIQAPPNLAEDDQSLRRYVAAGINDWGGVSPVTIDHVNPEAPWPPIARLRSVTESAGYLLIPRLTVYPRFAFDPAWVHKKVRPKVLACADTEAMSRDDSWHPGEAVDPPDVIARPLNWSGGAGTKDSRFAAALDSVRSGDVSESNMVDLFSARGPELGMLIEAADELRQRVSGETVTYVVNRNINYTNMCYFRCGFCAFSKGPKSLNLRGDPYLLEMSDIAERTAEAWQRGATEVCLQGGIHPSFTGDFYIQVLDTIKAAVPDIHIHAFSPLEIWQGAETKSVSIKDFLWELKDHGLSTLPGTAAEILDDRIRAVICPDKLDTAQWSMVARTAHSLGLPMSTTIMFGHADDHASWARHLMVLRNIQGETGGFTEFVPLPFVHMAAPIFLKGKARKGPTFEEALMMHSVARLALHPLITNIQASWVKLGTKGAQMALKAGCNDLGGTLMNEIISRSAGASHG
ncbi:MAG: 5-amino-6-(D-ribitylamino)uracil--L-tyrosine 4-hydroxyphenyl transferase CofH, partial [Actinobacteria bacterium]|nr:5-amino-6-(D-ribitylamino)uracil--L-tyrosine 4-hydroxyphenyl transferase CofH [Actinomycetota bacterium]